jgi:hypothetical protein
MDTMRRCTREMDGTVARTRAAITETREQVALIEAQQLVAARRNRLRR